MVALLSSSGAWGFHTRGPYTKRQKSYASELRQSGQTGEKCVSQDLSSFSPKCPARADFLEQRR
jgi:hypothetical protein